MVPGTEDHEPVSWWDAIAGFVFAVLCTALWTFVVLAALSSVKLLPPRQVMLEPAGSALLIVLLLFGPFWKIMRRDKPIFIGYAFGVLFTISVWWAANVG